MESSVNLNLVSGVPQDSVLGRLLFILHSVDMWKDLENKIILYADDTTLYVKVASPSDCISASNTLNSRSRTSHQPHPPITLSGLIILIIFKKT